MSDHSLSHFDRRTRVEAGGKKRTIHEPDAEARHANYQLLDALQGLDITFPGVALVKGKNILDNIRPHADNRHFFMLDFKDAYPSVDGDRVAYILASYNLFQGNAARAQAFLREYCLDSQTNGLAQGAPASPFLFNLFCAPLDEKINEFCDWRNITYTRYGDDMTFSVPGEGKIGRQWRRIIRDMIEDHGMSLSALKSRSHSLDNGPVTITGIALQPDGHWLLSPEHIETIDSVFKGCEEKVAQYLWLAQEDEDRLNGYNGVIVGMSDVRRQRPTKVERRLIERYERLKKIIRYQKRQTGAAAVHRTLIDPSLRQFVLGI